MTHARGAVVIASLMLMTGTSAWSQEKPDREGFWAGVQFGYGSLDKYSDREPHDDRGAFALAFNLGGTVNSHVRLGGQVNGWLLEAFEQYNPAKGVSVSQIFAIALVYPWSERDVFVKLGAGRAIYTDDHPDGWGSSGWGGTIGVGYDWPVRPRISLTPVVSYGRGGLGQVDNGLATIHNRSYRVLDFGIAVTYR